MTSETTQEFNQDDNLNQNTVVTTEERTGRSKNWLRLRNRRRDGKERNFRNNFAQAVDSQDISNVNVADNANVMQQFGEEMKFQENDFTQRRTKNRLFGKKFVERRNNKYESRNTYGVANKYERNRTESDRFNTANEMKGGGQVETKQVEIKNEVINEVKPQDNSASVFTPAVEAKPAEQNISQNSVSELKPVLSFITSNKRIKEVKPRVLLRISSASSTPPHSTR